GTDMLKVRACLSSFQISQDLKEILECNNLNYLKFGSVSDLSWTKTVPLFSSLTKLVWELGNFSIYEIQFPNILIS
ncbi:MAG: hypothetical protein U9O94_05410, partial [Nanoarchaeota archaeon]|nr:hypothetical protein [Nanoarchaeota archaeon]